MTLGRMIETRVLLLQNGGFFVPRQQKRLPNGFETCILYQVALVLMLLQ